MTQPPDDRSQQARQLYEAGDFEAAGRLYHKLWDEQGDAFSGGRYAQCLRKLGHDQAALIVACRVVERCSKEESHPQWSGYCVHPDNHD